MLWGAITELGGLYFFLLAIGFFQWTGNRRRAIGLALLLVVESLASAGLKFLFNAPRPPGAAGPTPSFPSGHSAKSAALFSFLMGKRYYILIIPLVVAVSRVQLGEHYWADVVAGLVLGGAIGVGMKKFWERPLRVLKRSERMAGFALAIFGTIIGVATAEIFPFVDYLGATLGLLLGFLMDEAAKPVPAAKAGKRLVWGIGGFAIIAYALVGTAGLLSFLLHLVLGLWVSYISVKIINQESRFSKGW